MDIFRVVIILGGNFPDGSYPRWLFSGYELSWVGNIPRWEFSEWKLSGGDHPGGNFPGGSFYVTSFASYKENLRKLRKM